LYHTENSYGMTLRMFIIISYSGSLWFDTENSYGMIPMMFMVCSECLWFDTENSYGKIPRMFMVSCSEYLCYDTEDVHEYWLREVFRELSLE